jgi:UDP-N-acetylmuramoyl-L-alanyl-D-glutamate--2,6-diaminopimelate ligase
MRLYQLIKFIPSLCARRAITDFNVKGISCNSKSVKPGFVFVAVKGGAADGRAFIAEAVGRGARAVFTGSGYPAQVALSKNLIEVVDCRRVLSMLAAGFHRRPASLMNVIGVTGTNGKTTVTYLIEAICAEAEGSPAVIGTVNYRFGGRSFPSHNTTPGPLQLHALLDRMRRSGVTHVAMEVSSHALDQERTADVDFSSAIFTNLTQDHLDYHKNLAAYFAAKAKLFTGLPSTALAIINCDDPFGRKLRKLTRTRVYTYGIGTGDIKATRLSMGITGSSFILSAPGGRDVKITTGLIGRHNVYNILAAAGWALASGISLAVVQTAIRKFVCVPGRMENAAAGGKFAVFVDYAHTDDALKNVLTAVRQVSRGRMIVVFGCGGDRDRGKRPKMGRAVSRYADYAIITNDNPRSESPMKIIREIIRGMSGENYRVIIDRREAIREAMRMARSGDTVLVAGKGHENYQIFADRTVPFDDREVVRECLRSRR